MKKQIPHIAFCFQLPADGSIPEWVMLVPAGRFIGRDGRWWINDQPDQVIANIKTVGRDVALDVNHASEIKAPQGEESPARGWFPMDSFENRNGEIWARLELNAAGRAAVEGREYRYLSPAIVFDPQTNRVISIKSVALTNQHNLDLPALNHDQSRTHQETDMLKAIAVKLGLNADASESEIIAAIGKMQGEHATALNAAQSPDLEKFVPRAEYDAKNQLALNAQTELATLKNAIRKNEVEALVGEAVKAGKVVPASKEFYVDLCMQEGGADKFKAFIEQQPVVVQPGTDMSGAAAQAAGVSLNAETTKVAAMLGVSADDIKKYGGEAA
jgi:phage I-like protein